MNIVMMTNTYLPMLGGVARSVAWFTEAFRAAGHRVLVVAPTFENSPRNEVDVVRLPAIQNFNGSDFSVRLPVVGLLTDELEKFQPDLVHAHHPFLLGDTALRVASLRNLPIVFTHHTMYEQYTHYVPGNSPALKRFAIRLATEYANLCHFVIAPSESIATLLQERGVTAPIAAIPTGIERERFANGHGADARRRHDIPPQAFLVGHVGRLAAEKNLAFLASAVARFLKSNTQAYFLVVGQGASRDDILNICQQAGVADRLRLAGPLDGQPLTDAYRAMNVFAMASKSETQGMVLAEAMTAGTPVVALDAPGAREVVRDRVNGRLLRAEDERKFAAALRWVADLPQADRVALRQAARQTSKQFAMPVCARRVLRVYRGLLKSKRSSPADDDAWSAIVRRIDEEWNIWAGMGLAIGDALFGSAISES